MSKIKIVVDSAGDIPDCDLKEYGIDMLCVPITVDGKGYFECKSFSIEEFYGVLRASKEIPATSRVPEGDYFRCYKKAMEQGYSDLISITINAGGSGTNASSQMARDRFYGEVPGAKESLRIHVVDSGTYSMGFGWPAVQSAKMARGGAGADKILDYLDDYFSSMEIYLGVYNLEYAKKSGRIGAAAAFAGEVLGLRPVIAMIAGATRTVDKVRGEKNIAPRLIQAYRNNCADKTAPVIIISGENTADAERLAELTRKETAAPSPVYMAGASIAINAGPRLLAIVCKGKNRGRRA